MYVHICDGVEYLKNKHNHPVSHILFFYSSINLRPFPRHFDVRNKNPKEGWLDLRSVLSKVSKPFKSFVGRGINFPLKIIKMEVTTHEYV